MDYTYLEKNLTDVKNKIKACLNSCGRDEDSLLLMPAVKYASIEEINYLHTLGVNDIGENRVQQMLEHAEKLSEGIRIHFIGSLQTNKVKYVIDKVCLIHSLDSDRLAAEIDKQAKKHNLIANVLVEINSGSEQSKGGILPCDAEEFCRGLGKYENIKLCGFMTMAPRCEDKSLYHKYFSETRELSKVIWKRLEKTGDPIISMGMSDSYTQAIEEGSTLVRVGSVLFKK